MIQKDSELKSFKQIQAKHIQCRVVEEEKWIDQNTCKIKELKLKNEHQACTANLAAHTPSRPDTCKSVDTKTATEDEEAWLRRMKSDFTAKLADYMARKSSCAAKGIEYDEAMVECEVKTSVHTERARTCNSVGANMDVQACQASSTSTTACSAQGTCYASAVTSYDAVKALVMKQEADHKVEYRIWKRVECMLGALGDGTAGTSDSAKLAECIKATYGTDGVLISYPKASPETCQANPMAPCAADYIVDAWTHLPAHSSGQCTPC